MMIKFADWLKENCNEELPKGKVNGVWFAERGLPMVVSCASCGMTMALPSAYIAEDTACLCHNCAGVEEED